MTPERWEQINELYQAALKLRFEERTMSMPQINVFANRSKNKRHRDGGSLVFSLRNSLV